MKYLTSLSIALNFCSVLAVTINEINGNQFLSPYNGQDVTGVSGIVTAKSSTGVYVRTSKPDRSKSSSDSVFVFDRNVGKNLTVGDGIIFDGHVQEFRSAVDDLFITEISSPKNVRKLSVNNDVTPVLVGRGGREPPTKQFSSLDDGDVFGYPNNRSQISVENPKLQPSRYGMDFWESLSGELVIIKAVTAITRPNNFRDTWVRGDWQVSGLNARGGLTMTDKDGNPEAIIIGSPLDGTKNPTTTKLGDQLEDIVGVVTWAFDYYRILPLTALKVKGSAQPATAPPTSLVSSKTCSGLTIADYNVENLAPTSAHLPKIADHIVNYLRTPDLLFLQEIQDNSGPTDDAVVSANLTLSKLVSEIQALSNINYAVAEVDPVNDQDGGQPGGNIRVAYLYNPTVVRLHKPNPGGSTDANEVLSSPNGPELKYNPGCIDPQNTEAWNASRKPLAAAWETLDGKNKFFTVNVHFASKGGSSSIEGDYRPPVNGVVEPRILQAEVTGEFISQILAQDWNARIITSGDFNEFVFAEPLERFVQVSGLKDLDEELHIPKVERYTYLFDMNSQQLDHIFVSSGVETRRGGYEHIHINSWADAAGMVSDHDPSVAKLNLCERGYGYGY